MALERELEIEGGKLFYRAEKGGIAISSCRVYGGRIKIPDAIDGLPVTGLHKKAFLSCKSLKEIWLPAGIREIGDWAFAYCSSLERVWLSGGNRNGNISCGKDIFKECYRLESVCRMDADSPEEEQAGRLLAAAPVKLEADYLFTPGQAGDEEWLRRFDDKLKEFLMQPDEDGFVKMVYCGEEDIVANVEYYLAERRREKARLCFLRLINHAGLSEEFAGELSGYLAGHTKGCDSEAAWEVVFKEHGNEQSYYEAFTKAGCLTEDNYDAVLLQMGGNYPEMKGYLMRYKSRNMEGTDFFDALSLD